MAFLPRSRAHASAQPPRPSRRWLRRRDRSRGQTMIEVALVLPIFIFTLMAVLEMGYFAAVGSAVSSASREGARYGATVGDTPGGDPHYVDCVGIRDAARLTSGALVNLADTQIDIEYVHAGSLTVFDTCPLVGSPPDPDVDIVRWDRIVVTVRHTYEPVTPLLRPIMGNQEMTSIDRRSIVKACTSC